MLPGDWYMLGITAVVVGGFAYRLVNERRQGITGLRADLTPQRARVSLGCVLLLALLMSSIGVVVLVSDGVTVGHGRLFAGVRLHYWSGAPLAFACAFFFVYLAMQFYKRINSAAPRAVTDEAGLASAKAAWSEALEEPDPRALSQAVRALLTARWGTPLRGSIDELARSLEGHAATLARDLLTDLDAVQYGGSTVSTTELDERFDELARLANDRAD